MSELMELLEKYPEGIDEKPNKKTKKNHGPGISLEKRDGGKLPVKDVMKMYSEGKSPSEIGTALGISGRQVSNLVWRMNNKAKRAGEPIGEIIIPDRETVKSESVEILDELPFDDIEPVDYDPMTDTVTVNIPRDIALIVREALKDEARHQVDCDPDVAIGLLNIVRVL